MFQIYQPLFSWLRRRLSSRTYCLFPPSVLSFPQHPSSTTLFNKRRQLQLHNTMDSRYLNASLNSPNSSLNRGTSFLGLGEQNTGLQTDSGTNAETSDERSVGGEFWWVDGPVNRGVVLGPTTCAASEHAPKFRLTDGTHQLVGLQRVEELRSKDDAKPGGSCHFVASSCYASSHPEPPPSWQGFENESAYVDYLKSSPESNKLPPEGSSSRPRSEAETPPKSLWLVPDGTQCSKAVIPHKLAKGDTVRVYKGTSACCDSCGDQESTASFASNISRGFP